MALSTNTMRGLIRYLPGTGTGKGGAVPRLIVHPDDTTPVYEPFYIRPTEVPSGTLAEGSIWFDDDNHTLAFYNGTANREVVTAPVGVASVGEVLSFRVGPHASVTEYDLFVAPRALQVTRIDVVPSTLQGGALTATIVKATGTATPANGTTPMHTANSINLNSGAYTVQNVTLTSTAADLVLAAGDRISIDYSAALTAGHAAITISFIYV